MFKKKFKEEEDNFYVCSEVDDNLPGRPQLNINKFKPVGDLEEELAGILKNKMEGKFSLNNHIHDLRFFDVQNFNSIITAFIHHKKPNEKILKLLTEIKCRIVNVIGKNEDEEMNTLETEMFTLEKIINSDEITSIPVTLQNNPKVIIYLDGEADDLETIIILNFFKKFKKNFLNIDLMILTDDSLTFPLHSGMNAVFLSRSLFTKKGIGLLPLEKSVISTKGLRWDVSKWETNFGGNVSTSNEFLDEESSIVVESGNVVFSAQIKPENIIFL
jgi:hypothetical protein